MRAISIMGAIPAAILGMSAAFALFFLWRQFSGEGAKPSLTLPPVDKSKATPWNVRSVGLRMAGGALVAVVCLGLSVFSTQDRGEVRPHWTPAFLIGSSLF